MKYIFLSLTFFQMLISVTNRCEISHCKRKCEWAGLGCKKVWKNADWKVYTLVVIRNLRVFSAVNIYNWRIRAVTYKKRSGVNNVY